MLNLQNKLILIMNNLIKINKAIMRTNCYLTSIWRYFNITNTIICIFAKVNFIYLKRFLLKYINIEYIYLLYF
jgi:hypothetical protein